MAKIFHAIKETVSFITILLFLILFLTAFATMYYGLIYLQNYINYPYFVIPIYYLNPFPQLVVWLVGSYAYAWYIFLVVILSICTILLFYIHGIDYFRKFLSQPFSYKKNGMQELVELYSLMLFIDVIIILFMGAVHYKPTNPIPENYPLYRLMLALLHASIYEEFLVRFLFLGVPVFLWHFFKNRNSERVRLIRIFGGGYKFGIPEITFLLISSTIFALAHVPSWGWWKFVPTFIGGLALGYLYLKYGLYLSILFHFATDFISVSLYIDKSLQLPFSLIILVLILGGIVFMASYFIRLLQFFGLIEKSPKKAEKSILPPPPPPWIDIKCPNCGSTNFIYLGNNTYKCISCGTVFKKENDDQTQMA